MINPWRIISTTEKEFCLDSGSLKNKGRLFTTSLARSIAQYLIRRLTHYSYPEIALYFNCDHSTVIHNCKRIEKMVQSGSNQIVSSTIIKLIKATKENHGYEIQNSN